MNPYLVKLFGIPNPIFVPRAYNTEDAKGRALLFARDVYGIRQVEFVIQKVGASS